jgi:CubicO group peptidase (beta-lactamase class C family)
LRIFVLVVVVVFLVVGTMSLVWLARRKRSPKRWRRVARLVTLVVSGLLLAVVAAGVGVYVWALTATDTSLFARALIWNESDVDDQHRFPFRTIHAASEPVVFRDVPSSFVEEIKVDPGQVPLDEYLAANETRALIVLRGDDVLYERYFNGASRHDLHTSFSVAKSFTATLVGIALEEGFLSSIDDPITEYVPELLERDTRFGDITIRHLITMSSGIRFEEWFSPWDDPTVTYYATDLRTAAVEHVEIEGPPGVLFHYNDYNPPLLGMALERATGMSVAQYTETRLWQPMGAEFDGSWSLDSEGSGFEKMFVGVNAAPIDYAKLGWLYLNGGRNGDDQVVPEAWVTEATRLDVTSDPNPEYQYFWWIDEDRNAYYAQGDKCQFIYVHPDADLVLVRTGRDCGDTYWTGLLGDIAEYVETRIGEG